jgi:hypothetical protein
MSKDKIIDDIFFVGNRDKNELSVLDLLLEFELFDDELCKSLFYY